jgi:hypothetical protein
VVAIGNDEEPTMQVSVIMPGGVATNITVTRA